MIRKAKMSDLKQIQEIFETARAYMRKNGNPNQWKDFEPREKLIVNDIKNENFYVMEDTNQNIYGVFAFITGPDESYNKIENGSWLNSEPYGTIHRIASNNTIKGVFSEAVNFSKKKSKNIRIDTHEDNKKMQACILNEGFKYCGKIHLKDGSPRLAYQYCDTDK